ncbi:hypothetical protein Leryth_023082, partial [Lithospermum erythrorhizon]
APGYQREYESRAAVNTVVLHPNQTELISGDQNGNIRVWDLTANSCSCELAGARGGYSCAIFNCHVGRRLGSCCQQPRDLLHLALIAGQP